MTDLIPEDQARGDLAAQGKARKSTPRTVTNRVEASPVTTDTTVIEPVPTPPIPPTPQETLASAGIARVSYHAAFEEGWHAALKEVESQWSHGTDGLSRFLATQKRQGRV